MDSFSRYNQIKIAPKDQHKFFFRCTWGTFFYKSMSFGLKNARTTYLREMMTILHDMMHIIMEDYMEDILEKSLKRKDHLTILGKIFDRLEEYNLQHNPKKYVFGVTSSKMLVYIISRRGIKMYLAKLKAII
jgi:hypothetical protein